MFRENRSGYGPKTADVDPGFFAETLITQMVLQEHFLAVARSIARLPLPLGRCSYEVARFLTSEQKDNREAPTGFAPVSDGLQPST